jgi:filamentous hemagglutinin
MAGTRPDGQPYRRPGLRVGTRQDILDAAPQTLDGRYINPHDGTPIEAGEEVFGHIYGREHWRLTEEAEALGLTQQEFNDWVNKHPEWVQIERRSDNESHRYEMPRDQ